MYNPYEDILNEIQNIKIGISLILDRVPKEQVIRKYSPKEIAEKTPISEQTVVAAIKDGRIKAERFGRKYLIPADEFERVCREVKTIKYKRK